MARVAAAQFDPRLGDKPHNLDAIDEQIATAAKAGAQLVVLPECAVTGYLYQDGDEAQSAAEPVPGPSTARIEEATRRHQVFAIVGLLEKDDHTVFNTAILSGPFGLEAVYRKTHTLCLGVDRFTTPGNIAYQVHTLPFGRVGILICYDLRFPEAARALAMRGAQIIALPTNWPDSSTIQPDIFTRARAAENRVFVVAADRVGTERGARFLGRSQIVGPAGNVLTEASQDSMEILCQDIEPAEADLKHVVIRHGEHEMDCFGDRRPELYDSLTQVPAIREAR